MQILSNGCMVDDSNTSIKKVWLHEGAEYVLKRRCNTDNCLNKNHMLFVIDKDHGLPIDHVDLSSECRGRLLTPEKARRIRDMLNNYTQAEVAELFCVSVEAVGKVARNITYKERVPRETKYQRLSRIKHKREEVKTHYRNSGSLRVTAVSYDVSVSWLKNLLKENS